MIYTIKKGKHTIGFRFGLNLFTKKITKHISFNESCKYLIKGEDQYDWSKLFGISQGYHKWNSFRVVWRYNPKKDVIEIGTYQYIKGKLFKSYLLQMPLGKVYKFELTVDKLYYGLSVTSDAGNNIHLNLFRRGVNLGYMLFPYFGGNQPAPQDISICIS